MTILSINALKELLTSVLTVKGFSSSNAAALASQTVLSEAMGQQNLGLEHIFDYVSSLDEGRIDGHAEPEISRPAPTMIHVDAHKGLAQTGFDKVFGYLVTNTQELGMSVFLQKNAMLCGALGTYAIRLAEAGLVSFAATNGSPLMAGSGSSKAVYCTNPMAFSAPQKEGPPLLIDQSSSATAYVNIRAAAQVDEKIPLDWAVDKKGEPTSDAREALKGTLLAFGGARGANIALMVEVLAAGVSGAKWSLDAPSFDSGNQNPDSGMFVLAIDPKLIDPDFEARMTEQITRLSGDYGVYIPGASKAARYEQAIKSGLSIDSALIARIKALAPTT